MFNEVWKSVKDYNGFYEVSNLGRIRSVDRYVRWKQCNRFYPGKVRLIGRNEYGYRTILFSKDGVEKCRRVSRLVALAFIPNPKRLPEVNHKDGNKLNDHVSNLEWCTKSDNIKHAWRTGLNKGNTKKKFKDKV